MIEFVTTILKFDKKDEKTGWTYIEVPADLAQKLKPGNKKSFRVHGKLDNYYINRVALIPMGQGGFIMAINEAMRKGIGKRHGAMLKVKLHLDNTAPSFNQDFFNCILEDMDALKFFKTLPKSHQMYFSKWIESAKTEATKGKRIAQALNALTRRQRFNEMLRALKGDRGFS